MSPLVMFVDLDFAHQYPTLQVAAKSVWEAVRGLFRRREHLTQTPQDRLLEQVQRWHSQHPDWALRVYRTRAGLRLLVARENENASRPRRMFSGFPAATLVKSVMDCV